MLTRLYDVFSDAQEQLTPKSAAEVCPNSNSSKLLYLSSLPAKMKKIQSKMKELESQQDFPNYKSMGIFSDVQGQLTRIWLKFKLVRDIMVVLVSCKYEEDPIKTEGARVLTRFFHYNPMGAIRCHGKQSSNPIWP